MVYSRPFLGHATGVDLTRSRPSHSLTTTNRSGRPGAPTTNNNTTCTLLLQQDEKRRQQPQEQQQVQQQKLQQATRQRVRVRPAGTSGGEARGTAGAVDEAECGGCKKKMSSWRRRNRRKRRWEFAVACDKIIQHCRRVVYESS